MTANDATSLGIAEQHRRLHIRVDDAKNNMAPPAASAEWIKLVSTSLDNATPEYPKGDSVQVARSWEPPTPLEGVGEDAVEACFDFIVAGLPDGERYSNRPQDDRWAGHVLIERLDRSRERSSSCPPVDAGRRESKNRRCADMLCAVIGSPSHGVRWQVPVGSWTQVRK